GGSCESEARAGGRGPATPVDVWGRSHQGRQKRCDEAVGLEPKIQNQVPRGWEKSLSEVVTYNSGCSSDCPPFALPSKTHPPLRRRRRPRPSKISLRLRTKARRPCA